MESLDSRPTALDRAWRLMTRKSGLPRRYRIIAASLGFLIGAGTAEAVHADYFGIIGLVTLLLETIFELWWRRRNRPAPARRDAFGNPRGIVSTRASEDAASRSARHPRP